MKAFITGITGMVGSQDNIESLGSKKNSKDRVFLNYGNIDKARELYKEDYS